MIIPIKCVTCGKVIADKYKYYQRKVMEAKKADKISTHSVTYLTEDNKMKTHEGIIMDELGLKRQCCRRHFLAHVDIQ